MREGPIYLDHHATTPCDPRVVEAMRPFWSDLFGNPASRQHAFGRAAREAVEAARGEVAALLGCDAAEVVFTSGATEANNLALKGVSEAYRDRGGHLVTVSTEHKSVLDAARRLERGGMEVTYLAVDRDGRLDPAAVEAALRPETVLVSVMLANNEIGTVQPIAEIAAGCRARGVLVHCDAAQALAHLDCDVGRLGVDLLSLSAHKAYGPKGIGALYVRRRRPRVRLAAQIDGGGHERGYRSGTLNVPAIVGFGRACALIAQTREDEARRIAALRDDLLARLRRALPDLQVHGSLAHRLPNNLSFSVPGLTSEKLLARLDEVAVSSGAACSSANASGSYVLAALGCDAETAAGSLRVGLGRSTTAAEVERAAGILVTAIEAERLAGRPEAHAACAPAGGW